MLRRTVVQFSVEVLNDVPQCLYRRRLANEQVKNGVLLQTRESAEDLPESIRGIDDPIGVGYRFDRDTLRRVSAPSNNE
ncbi:MAG TPA: hypothetical protein VGB27_17825 [Candidatus Binatia bacterium]